jgi:glutathione S-transferase
MQDTIETSIASLLAGTRKPYLKLVIGDKNLSSWSMRAWLALKAFGIPFDEILIRLDQPDTIRNIADYSASGRIPILISDDLTIWDSLAICEYVAELFPAHNLWPQDQKARAVARSICAEMHSGFAALRNDMPMNIAARLPGKGRSVGAQADIGRISEIWEECLSNYGAHEYLFGDFSIADAYYAPVVMRFNTYGVSLAPALQAYVERVTAHPAVAEWIRDAVVDVESSQS